MKAIGKIFILFGIVAFFVLVFGIVNEIRTPKRKYSNGMIMYPITNLNIRKGPGTEYAVIKTVNMNTKLLTYDSAPNGFILVLKEDSTKYGWASKTYLRTNPAPKEPKSVQAYPEKNTLPVETRKEIFFAIVVAQDHAQAEADKKYVVDIFDPKYKQGNIIKNVDMYNELEKNYINEITRKYNLSDDDLSSIKLEGVKKQWPMPKLKTN